MQIIKYVKEMSALALVGETQGLFFLIAVYVLMMSIYSLVFQVRVASWPSVVGNLVDERIVEFGYEYTLAHKEYKVSLYYSYVVNGNTYTGDRLSPWLFITSYNAVFILRNQLKLVLRHTNGLVTVYYNPKNPQKSFLIKPGLLGKVVTLVLSVIPLFLYFNKYHG